MGFSENSINDFEEFDISQEYTTTIKNKKICWIKILQLEDYNLSLDYYFFLNTLGKLNRKNILINARLYLLALIQYFVNDFPLIILWSSHKAKVGRNGWDYLPNLFCYLCTNFNDNDPRKSVDFKTQIDKRNFEFSYSLNW